jgi:cytochrome c peroxidase
VTPTVAPTPEDPRDTELRALIDDHGLTGMPEAGRDLPDISDPLAQLGMKLFFSMSLGGDFDSACASCHHPMLGGADALSLSVGVDAIDPNLLGPGRTNPGGVPLVPRHTPTSFNVGLQDAGLFWDSRVESIGRETGRNGAGSGISTPDSGRLIMDRNAGMTLASAQARFPVTSIDEMRGSLASGAGNERLRAHLASRLGDYDAGAGEIMGGSWLAEFQSAFASAETARTLITFDNISAALAAYERSQVFTNNPWQDYVLGNDEAISNAAKDGAILFLTDADDNGAGCVQCHSGDTFTDEQHHVIGAPQFGPGTGNPDANDFGRENVTGDPVERFRFRTPSLLNVAVTALYTHAGAYQTLAEIVNHYDNPRGEVDGFFDAGGWCTLPQFEFVSDCQTLYPNARTNTELALDKIGRERNQNDPAALPNININNQERQQLVAFLETLTDACVTNRDCLDAWIPLPEAAPDNHQLNAIDLNGNAL